MSRGFPLASMLTSSKFTRMSLAQQSASNNKAAIDAPCSKVQAVQRYYQRRGYYVCAGLSQMRQWWRETSVRDPMYAR
eukprot:4553217-Amphidinium_carterae.1